MPSSRSYQLLGTDVFQTLKEAIENGEELVIYADLHGARNIHTSIQHGKHNLGLNTEYSEFKQFKETKTNSFSGKETTRFYFKKLKSQGIEEYKKFLAAAIAVLEVNLGVKIQAEKITVYCNAF